MEKDLCSFGKNEEIHQVYAQVDSPGHDKTLPGDGKIREDQAGDKNPYGGTHLLHICVDKGKDSRQEQSCPKPVIPQSYQCHKKVGPKKNLFHQRGTQVNGKSPAALNGGLGDKLVLPGKALSRGFTLDVADKPFQQKEKEG